MPFPLNLFPLNYRAYQCCHFQHLRRVPNTRAVEMAGTALMANAALNIAVVRNFTTGVCGWGGRTGNRILWRIQATPDAVVLNGIAGAIQQFGAGNIPVALTAIQTIGGLGAFSYASKHLRMLAPNLCGVFDSVVEKFLRRGYAGLSRRQMFLDYCQFCQDKARELTNARVMLGDYITTCSDPYGRVQLDRARKQSNWTAADVDMACFAWLQKWCSGCRRSAEPEAIPHVCPEVPISAPAPEKSKAPSAADSLGGKQVIYLCQNHDRDTALTIKEDCDSNWNIAWICRDHGSLDFKQKGARGTRLYLAGGILAQGTDITTDARWQQSRNGGTCHHAGSGYMGHLRLGTATAAVKYLKRFFRVVACPGNQTETQAWVDAL